MIAHTLSLYAIFGAAAFFYMAAGDCLANDKTRTAAQCFTCGAIITAAGVHFAGGW